MKKIGKVMKICEKNNNETDVTQEVKHDYSFLPVFRTIVID